MDKEEKIKLLKALLESLCFRNEMVGYYTALYEFCDTEGKEKEALISEKHKRKIRRKICKMEKELDELLKDL